jgi:hypothetical protein
VVPDLRALARFPWTGHNALCGTVPRSWQDTRTILSQFGPTPRRAFVACRASVREGVPLGPRPELQGGGLIRSLGGWAAVQTLRRGREVYLGDERVLGSSEFVSALRHSAEAAATPGDARLSLETLVGRVCQHVGIASAALVAGGRTARASRAREGIAYLWVDVLGHAGRPLAPLLGICPQNIYRAVAPAWEQLLTT